MINYIDESVWRKEGCFEERTWGELGTSRTMRYGTARFRGHIY